jgi:hypothetical protein
VGFVFLSCVVKVPHRGLGCFHAPTSLDYANWHPRHYMWASGMSPLHIAAYWGPLELVQLLLDNGADAKATTKVRASSWLPLTAEAAQIRLPALWLRATSLWISAKKRYCAGLPPPICERYNLAHTPFVSM